MDGLAVSSTRVVWFELILKEKLTGMNGCLLPSSTHLWHLACCSTTPLPHGRPKRLNCLPVRCAACAACAVALMTQRLQPCRRLPKQHLVFQLAATCLLICLLRSYVRIVRTYVWAEEHCIDHQAASNEQCEASCPCTHNKTSLCHWEFGICKSRRDR